MLRTLCVALFCLSLTAQSVVGAPIQLISGLPSSFIPGQPFAFDVSLPAISNLGSYNIDLVLESANGSAGADFFFDAPATVPAATNYVFPSAANYADAAQIGSAQRHRITLTDFDFAGTNVVPGVNDRVARVTVRTAPSFAGPLSLAVDDDQLIFDTPAVNPTPVTGFDALRSDIAAGGSIELASVPEPVTAWLVVHLILCAMCSRREVGRG